MKISSYRACVYVWGWWVVSISGGGWANILKFSRADKTYFVAPSVDYNGFIIDSYTHSSSLGPRPIFL